DVETRGWLTACRADSGSRDTRPGARPGHVDELCHPAGEPGLMGYDEELLPVSELADTVDVSDDQTTYTFTLRKDALFHDGRRVEAEDAAWSLARALNPATAAAAGTALSGTTFLSDIGAAYDVMAVKAETLAGIEVIDARSLRITLEGPSTTFLMRLASIP